MVSWPILQKITLIYLPQQCHVKDFFLAGYIVQQKRSSENVNKLVCLSNWLKIVDSVTGAPQGCVLSPLLTQDCIAKFSSNHIIKFADDTTVVGLISNNDETHYREEVAQLVEWCGTNNLYLHVSKTMEVVMDFRRNSVDHPPLTIDSSTVERVSSTKFLGMHITEDLTWTTNTTSLSKKAQQRLHFLR